MNVTAAFRGTAFSFVFTGMISAMGFPLLVMRTLFFFVLTSSKTDEHVALNLDTDMVSMVFSLLGHNQITVVILWPSPRDDNGGGKVDKFTGEPEALSVAVVLLDGYFHDFLCEVCA